MWPIPARNSSLVVMNFKENQLSLGSFIKQDNNHSILYTLKAYRRILVNTANHNIFFNLTLIKKHVCDYFKTYALQDASVIITISGQNINEQTTTSILASPSYEDLKIPDNSNILSNYIYLYPNNTGFTFYTYHIKKEYIAQYQLFAIAVGLNLMHIIPQSYAYLELYRSLKGSQFRQNQLAIEMSQKNNNFEKLVDYNDIKSILRIDKNIVIQSQEESPYLCASLGAIIAANIQN